MKFRTELSINSSLSLAPSVKTLSIGSCFSIQMNERLQKLGMQSEINPFGTTYNPKSVASQLERLANPTPYRELDINESNGNFFCFDYHGDFSNANRGECLRSINTHLAKSSTFYKESNTLILTLGTAFVYEDSCGKVVNNCHKQPSSMFSRRIIESSEIVDLLRPKLLSYLKKTPDRKVIVSVSPVRHLRDSFTQNQISKSHLLIAADKLCNSIPNATYFPAYEILLDDLRDYRFFEPDMCHPNSLAQDYGYSN